MSISIVSTAQRPDLAPITAEWRWNAFFRHRGVPYDDILDGAVRTAQTALPMPQTFVLLAGDMPVGTASLAAKDLDERPDLTPWLASVFVVDHARGQGHAGRLVAAVEDAATEAGFSTLWLYTRTAERIYARLGWQTTETVQHQGNPYALMRRTLSPAPLRAVDPH